MVPVPLSHFRRYKRLHFVLVVSDVTLDSYITTVHDIFLDVDPELLMLWPGMFLF